MHKAQFFHTAQNNLYKLLLGSGPVENADRWYHHRNFWIGSPSLKLPLLKPSQLPLIHSQQSLKPFKSLLKLFHELTHEPTRSRLAWPIAGLDCVGTIRGYKGLFLRAPVRPTVASKKL